MRTTDGDYLLPNMTREQALQIRAWRERGSWRQVATRIHNSMYQGVPAEHQSAGEDICRQAANLLGEDPDQSPWN